MNKPKQRFVAKYHDAERKIHRLPFVAGPGAGGGDSWWWALPACGDYGDGCAAGKAAALSWLKAKRQATASDFFGGSLQMIVFAMSERLAKAKGRERTVLRGHIVGFFSELDAWAAAAARWEANGGTLDTLTESEVCTRLQDAADLGPSKRYVQELKAEASARARAAARARWASRKRAA